MRKSGHLGAAAAGLWPDRCAMTASSPRATELEPRSIAIVLGTRPELIKLSVLLRMLGPAAETVHTGQHYEPVLTLEALGGGRAPSPHVQLDSGGLSRGEQIATVVCELTRRWAIQPPGVVVVHGDTNATLAGALAANADGLPLVHVEAGLRSLDRRMPEEHNRIVVDHLADLNCAPTLGNVANLAREAVPAERMALTGNTIVEALAAARRDRSGADRLLAHLDARERFVLATLHRPENVDDREQLRLVLGELSGLSLPVVLVLHPRTRERIQRFGLGQLLEKLRVTGPLAYPVFLALADRARLLISDSGGLQEEASVLKQHLVVLRRSTERPEALGTFATLLPDPTALRDTAAQRLSAGRECLRHVPSPFGDGSASARILEAIRCLVSKGAPSPVPPRYATTDTGTTSASTGSLLRRSSGS